MASRMAMPGHATSEHRQMREHTVSVGFPQAQQGCAEEHGVPGDEAAVGHVLPPAEASAHLLVHRYCEDPKCRASLPSGSSLEPIHSQQSTHKGDDVQGFSPPRPKRPPGDSRRECNGWGLIKRYLLKCEHLRDEKQTAPHAHDDVGAQGDQEQAAHSRLTPGHHQRQKEAECDGHMHRDPEPLQGDPRPFLQ